LCKSCRTFIAAACCSCNNLEFYCKFYRIFSFTCDRGFSSHQIYKSCDWVLDRLCIIMWVSTSPGEYRYVGFFEVAGGGRVLAPPTAGNVAV